MNIRCSGNEGVRGRMALKSALPGHPDSSSLGGHTAPWGELSAGPLHSAREKSHVSRVLGLLSLHTCSHRILMRRTRELGKNLESPFPPRPRTSLRNEHDLTAWPEHDLTAWMSWPQVLSCKRDGKNLLIIRTHSSSKRQLFSLLTSLRSSFPLQLASRGATLAFLYCFKSVCLLLRALRPMGGTRAR